MLCERGIKVDHTTIYRWVQRYAPEIEKRLKWYWRPGLRISGSFGHPFRYHPDKKSPVCQPEPIHSLSGIMYISG